MSTTKVIILGTQGIPMDKVSTLAYPGEHFKVIRRGFIAENGGLKVGETWFNAQELIGIGIESNKAQCLNCLDTLESVFTHHACYCSCGNLHIDGGRTRLLRKAKGKFKELSTYYKMK